MFPRSRPPSSPAFTLTLSAAALCPLPLGLPGARCRGRRVRSRRRWRQAFSFCWAPNTNRLNLRRAAGGRRGQAGAPEGRGTRNPRSEWCELGWNGSRARALPRGAPRTAGCRTLYQMRFVRPSYRIVYRFSARASPVTPYPILGGERSDRESSVPLSGDRTCGCVWSATD